MAGISLSYQTRKRTRLATQIANGYAIAVSTIGLLTLCEYMFGWHLGIDELLVRDLVGGDVARRFVPIAIVVPLVLGWSILRGHQANFYDTNFAFSLMSISLVAILLGLIELNAGILNRVDYDRIRSADRIRLPTVGYANE